MDQNVNIEAIDDPRPAVTAALTRGVGRLLRSNADAVLTELRLANGRRADVVGLSPKGMFTIVEVKSCLADFEQDSKWPEYLGYCDQFFFCVSENFPTEYLPVDEGLIIADKFGGEVIRSGPQRPLPAARRKAMTLRFARSAAFSPPPED